MRITSGKWGGLALEVPLGIRPTQDKVRQAIFSSLGDVIIDARVLDLFAGSGAMGLEALSRGASEVWWVEESRKVCATLRQNVDRLGGDVKAVRCENALRFLEGKGEPFGVVFADPPYDRGQGRQVLEKTLIALEGSPMFSPSSVLVYELGVEEDVISRPGWEILRDRRYGGTRVLIYRRSTA
jgi:16S rRNA (guanine966-N2)-methyltransferase